MIDAAFLTALMYELYGFVSSAAGRVASLLHPISLLYA
jgi:hypothetical protein